MKGVAAVSSFVSSIVTSITAMLWYFFCGLGFVVAVGLPIVLGMLFMFANSTCTKNQFSELLKCLTGQNAMHPYGIPGDRMW